MSGGTGQETAVLLIWLYLSSHFISSECRSVRVQLAQNMYDFREVARFNLQDFLKLFTVNSFTGDTGEKPGQRNYIF